MNWRKILEKFVIEIAQNSNRTFITYKSKPQYLDGIVSQSPLIQTLPQLAIIIQGQLIKKNNFTLETIKLYKRNFPKALIVLSTWNDIDQNDIDAIKNLDIHFLLNGKPDFAGPSNINFQIVSTNAGMLKAKELGAKYALKTRTDQRMYEPNIDKYLYNVIEFFKYDKKEYKQNKRIIGLSINTFKYRMYGLSDMFLYGHIDDMLIYWSVNLDIRRNVDAEINTGKVNPINFAFLRICEVYLATEYLKRIGRNLEWTIQDSFSVFADHFCIIDNESLGFYWGKYGFREDRWKTYEDKINLFEEVDFKEWLDFYLNRQYKFIPNEILGMYSTPIN